MNDSVALDTNIIIDFFNNDSEICKHIFQTKQIYIPVVAYGEFLVGLRVSRNKVSLKKEAGQFFQSTHIIHADSAVANIYADLSAMLRKSGTLIPVNDIWIAACCLRRDVPLATRDIHFKRIRQLKTKYW